MYKSIEMSQISSDLLAIKVCTVMSNENDTHNETLMQIEAYCSYVAIPIVTIGTEEFGTKKYFMKHKK